MHGSDSASLETSVLFVCLGNICRSPLAEGVFRHMVATRGLEDRFHIDSAGTGAWHAGEAPDARSAQVARDHGIELKGRARQVEPQDLGRFDVIVAMDRENLESLEHLAATRGLRPRIALLRDFDADADGDEVPDPYYGGSRGFETVYEMIHAACEGLLDELGGGGP